MTAATSGSIMLVLVSLSLRLSETSDVVCVWAAVRLYRLHKDPNFLAHAEVKDTPGSYTMGILYKQIPR